MISGTLTKLERAVLDKLTCGESPLLQVLGNQVAHCIVTKREFTGVGFFTRLWVPDNIDRIADPVEAFSFGDVQADMPGLRHGAGFLLWVRQGSLDFLEGYAYDEPWPENIESFALKYFPGARRDEEALLRNVRSSGPLGSNSEFRGRL